MMFEHEEAIIATKEEITGIKLAGKKKHLIVLRTMYDEITKRGDCICIKDLDITGNDLMEYGLKGPEIGKTLNELLGVVYKEQKNKREAELKILHEQIKPHFLYNTLDTIQWMAKQYHAQDIVDLVLALSGFFRISLSQGKEFITLEQEVLMVKNYLDIQKVYGSVLFQSQRIRSYLR